MDIYYRFKEEATYYEIPGARVVLEEYEVVKKTKCGAWIRLRGYHFDRMHFVLDVGRKRFAYPTEALALESFLVRKRRHLEHLESKVEVVRAALRMASMPGFKPTRDFTCPFEG